MNIPGDPAETGATVSPWRGAGPELVIAGVVIAVAAAAGYLLAGWAGLSVAVTAGAAAAMVVLRYLLPTPTLDAARKAREKPQARLLSGYSHRRSVVHNSIASRGFYTGELRPVLEHLLAARLAERHGVHLYQDPEAARRLLCRRPRDADLWEWIEPVPKPPEIPKPREGAQPETRASKASTERGIPRRTLARLIDRLERL
jgi:hypothetical protein